MMMMMIAAAYNYYIMGNGSEIPARFVRVDMIFIVEKYVDSLLSSCTSLLLLLSSTFPILNSTIVVHSPFFFYIPPLSFAPLQ